MRVRSLPVLLLLTLISTAMAQDVYSTMMKETHFAAPVPTDAQSIAANWNEILLLPSRIYTHKSADLHQGSTGGIDLVRIVLGSNVGDLTTLQSIYVHVVTRAYVGPTGNAELAAAIRTLATDALPGVSGTFTFDRDEDGVQRFTCSAPNAALVGLFYGGQVGVGQQKQTETALSTPDLADNASWFSIIGKPKTGP